MDPGGKFHGSRLSATIGSKIAKTTALTTAVVALAEVSSKPKTLRMQWMGIAIPQKRKGLETGKFCRTHPYTILLYFHLWGSCKNPVQLEMVYIFRTKF